MVNSFCGVSGKVAGPAGSHEVPVGLFHDALVVEPVDVVCYGEFVLDG